MEAKLEFTLKQDSPMIHFQGDEAGATLRASEVKPKLDRFLKEWCRRKKTGLKKEWKSDPDRDALNYKMRFFAVGEQCLSEKEQTTKLPSYFGDIGQSRRNILYRTVRMEILCFDGELREILNGAMETFFVLHNFGTRQNRGIGGFTLKTTTPQKAEEILTGWYQGDENNRITVYKMEFVRGTRMRPQDMQNILRDGNRCYQILKSGINFNGVYIKSYLTKYFLNRRIGGEKRWMKQQNILPAIGKSPRNQNNSGNVNIDRYRYIRGLLGITGAIRYKKTVKGPLEEEPISISGELERIPSPIRYKIVGNVLFIIPLNPKTDVYGKKFYFENPSAGEKGTLKIPEKDEFNMGRLMDGFYGYANQKAGIRTRIVKCKGGGNR